MMNHDSPVLAAQECATELHGLLCANAKAIGLAERVCGKEARPAYIEWMAKQCKAGRVWIFMDDGMIVGMMVIEPQRPTNIAYIVSRRTGLGPRLIEHAQAIASGVLVAEPRNDQSRLMLESCGFLATGKTSADGFPYYSWVPQGLSKKKGGDRDLRAELERATKLQVVDDYNNEIDRLRGIYRHSVTVAAPPHHRSSCYAYALGLSQHPDYLRIAKTGVPGLAVISGPFMRHLRAIGVLAHRGGRALKPGAVILYSKGRGQVTHAGVILADGSVESQWGPAEIHRHGLWEVPASYGDHYSVVARPDAAQVLASLERWVASPYLYDQG